MAQIEEINKTRKNSIEAKRIVPEENPNPARSIDGFAGIFEVQREFFRLWSNFGNGTMTEEKEEYHSSSQPVFQSYENLMVNPVKAAAAYWASYNEFVKSMNEFFENNIELLKENTKPFIEWYASASSILIPPK